MQEQAGFWLSPQQKFAWRVQEALGHSARTIGVSVDRGQGGSGPPALCAD